MAEDKKDTLTKLYSIRAGISAVAVEREKVEEINRNTEQEIEKLNEQIYSFNAQIAKDEKEIENLEEKIGDDKYYIKKHKDDKMPKKPKKSGAITASCFFSTIVILAIIYSIIYLTGLTDKLCIALNDAIDNDVFEIIFIIFIILGLISIFFTIVFIREAREDTSEKNADYDRELRKYNDIQKEISNCENRLEENQQRVSVLKNEVAKSEKAVRGLEDLIEDLKAKAEAACTPHYQLGNMIQQQFENNFTGFLNLRDWRNTDIIIFAYESGRVDNMKEALAYVDGEVRTDRIVKAINDSSKAICRSIQSGLRDLAVGMGKCFSIISEQIAQQTKYLDKISADMGKLAQNTANVSKGLSALAGKVDYSNALLEQRNKSADKIYQDNEMFLVQARNYMSALDTQRNVNGGYV